MYVEGSTGPMLQGVSQQPERLRVSGQVGLQVNYDSVISKGITSRPGTDARGRMSAVSAGTAFSNVKLDGVEYLVGYRAGSLRLWDTTGVEYAVSGSAAYCGVDMAFYSDASKLICVNRDKVVTQAAASAAPTFYAAVVTALGGQFSREYKITVSGAFGTRVGSYTTPAGTTAGDAAKTSSDYIIAQLWSAFLAPGAIANMGTTYKGSVLAITYPSALTASVVDGAYGEVLRVTTSFTDDVEDLPEYSFHGHTVLVQGGASADDDYYLQFTVPGGTTGGSFGADGVWREVAAPGLVHAFDLTTMPHEVTINYAAKTAVIAQGGWLPRRVGDLTSNPAPSFIGSTIRDVAGFESRIVFAAGAKVVMTRSGEGANRDFFKKSATTAVSSDPIDIFSTKAKDATIDWIIPFDRNLLLVSDPGSAQFVITGGGLTPSNASMVLTTDYTIDSGTRPVTTGRTAMLPFTAGQFSGLNEFFTNDSVATNGADPLTSGQDRYIIGRITGMAAAVNFNQVAILADGAPSYIWMYQYLWGGTERLQSAWYQRKMPASVRHIFYSGGDLFIVMNDPQGSTDTLLLRMDLNRADDDTGFHITLDCKASYTVGAGGTIVAALADLQFVQRAGCQNPGQYVEVSSVLNANGTTTYTLDTDIAPAGATLTGGLAVPRQLVPTMPVYRDFKDRVVSKAILTVNSFLVHMENSGDVRATFDSPWRDSRDFYPRRFWLDDNPLDPDRVGVEDYTLRVPWGEQTTRSTLTVSSEDVRPDTILEIEWTGDVRGARKRI